MTEWPAAETDGLQRAYSNSRTKLGFEKGISEAAEKSPFVWAVSYIALPKGIAWSFDDMKWQMDIFDDLHPTLVVIKPTQIGLTTIATLKGLWFISYIRSRLMYTLPRRDDVTDYVAATVNPIIEGSEFLATRVGRTDTLRMKRIGDSFFHVMEASVTPRMLPVDILINDEVDMSDQTNIEQFVARLDRSKYKYHYRFSTPTVAGYGIDADFERSDRREWLVTCSRCNREQFLDWEVHLATPEGKDPYYACEKCREPIRADDIINGKWAVTNPQSNTHGYHVSHMMLPITRPPRELLAEKNVMDTRTFHNLRLGKPWRPVGGSMPMSMFIQNSFSSGHSRRTHREKGHRYYLGADQGNEVHVVVCRVPDGSDKIEIVYIEHIKGGKGDSQFERLGAIMRMFDIDLGVCDANPNRASIYRLAGELHGSLGAADIGSFNYPYKWHGFNGDAAYKVTCSRTDMLDGLRDDIARGRISFYGNWGDRSRLITDVIAHCGNLKRDTTTRKMQSGGEKVVGVWRSVGADHFAFAMALLRLAVEIGPRGSGFDFVELSDIRDDSVPMKIKKSKVWEGQVYYVEDIEEQDKRDRFHYRQRLIANGKCIRIPQEKMIFLLCQQGFQNRNLMG
jgi:hypothetical protein